MSEIELQTEIDGQKAIGSKLSVKSYKSSDLLDSFKQRCNTAMWAMTEHAIAAVMPDGVNAEPWMRAHGMRVDVNAMPQGVRHRVIKDGDVVAEVTYRNGTIVSKVRMGRGVALDWE